MPTRRRSLSLAPATLFVAVACAGAPPAAEAPAAAPDRAAEPLVTSPADPTAVAVPGPAPTADPALAPAPDRGAGDRVVTGPSEPAAAAAFAPNARVRCQWKNGGREYAGRVVGTSGGRLMVDYDDGDKEAIAPSLCRGEADAARGAQRVVTGPSDVAAAAAWTAGTRVRCRWKDGSVEYAGTVVGAADGRLLVDYDDGDKEAITPSRCRKDAGATAAPTAAGASLAGEWKILRGANPGGSQPYSGSVRVGARGSAWSLAWTIPGSTPYSGVGIELGGILAVGWSQSGARHGVVVYRVDGGRLSGKWTSDQQSGSVGTEDLAGPAGLSGEYAIVAATTPSGGTYAGKVSIRPTGKTYQLEWRLTNESYRGVGILRNGVLAVGWGTGDGVGVVSYAIRPGELEGAWAQPGGSEVGVEVLQRQRT
ncbi:MAG: hypothetical protein IT376_12935 [Polyangiaceae bacterium]|nr:hypothetical protein [Polyangiaceae bacterium]